MSGRRVASSSQTVAEYLDYWLQEHARHRVRDTTYASYEWLIADVSRSAVRQATLTALRPNDIRRGFFQLKQTCQCCAQGKDQAREDRAGAPCVRSGPGSPPEERSTDRRRTVLREDPAGVLPSLWCPMARFGTCIGCCGPPFKTLYPRTRS